MWLCSLQCLLFVRPGNSRKTDYKSQEQNKTNKKHTSQTKLIVYCKDNLFHFIRPQCTIRYQKYSFRFPLYVCFFLTLKVHLMWNLWITKDLHCFIKAKSHFYPGWPKNEWINSKCFLFWGLKLANVIRPTLMLLLLLL